MKTQLSNIAMNVRKYRFADGTYEIWLGFYLLWGGISLHITHSVIPVLLLFLSGAFVMTKAIELIQKRYIYPRFGYVQYHEDAPSHRWQLILATLGACALFGLLFGLALFIDKEHAFAWAMPSMAIVIGGILVVYGLYYQTRRVAIVSIISILAGFALSPLFLEYEATRHYLGMGTFPVYCIGLGALLIISGGVAFARNIHVGIRAGDAR